ncbi:MAG: hypothetical protein ABIC91_03255 [Nanoarchaeota archaeon]|nr:hypothetical protein [Nanoarchaeota archaeon]MBU1030059.1 hypothetical protein [Nanoarchaeota archaeon]MBU1850456.1 hypothetical protein [Nanoarchaeota archaeon]
MFSRKKVYGEYKKDICPFCEKQATSINQQGVPVCQQHKTEELPLMKCVCGETLDLKTGKFGAYFHCMNCGNISFHKAMDINPKINFERKKEATQKKEITVTSDEADFIF